MDNGLDLELLSVADICLRTGQNVCERYKNIQGAHRDLGHLNTWMENVWKDIACQLRAVLSSSGAIPDILRRQMVDLLYKLQFSLHTAYGNLEKTTDKRGKAVTKTIKFAVFLKRSLQKDVSVFEKWKNVFATTFFMLPVPESRELDQILATEVEKNGQPSGSSTAMDRPLTHYVRRVGGAYVANLFGNSSGDK